MVVVEGGGLRGTTADFLVGAVGARDVGVDEFRLALVFVSMPECEVTEGLTRV